jgi:hypothetical protein
MSGRAEDASDGPLRPRRRGAVLTDLVWCFYLTTIAVDPESYPLFTTPLIMFTGIDDEVFNATHRQLFAEGMAMLDSNACLPLL